MIYILYASFIILFIFIYHCSLLLIIYFKLLFTFMRDMTDNLQLSSGQVSYSVLYNSWLLIPSSWCYLLTLSMYGGLVSSHPPDCFLAIAPQTFEMESWNWAWLIPIQAEHYTIFLMFSSGQVTDLWRHKQPSARLQNVTNLQHCQWQPTFRRKMKLSESNKPQDNPIFHISDFSCRSSEIWLVTSPIISLRGIPKLLILQLTRTGGGHIMSPLVFRKYFTNGGAQHRHVSATYAKLKNTPCVQILTSQVKRLGH